MAELNRYTEEQGRIEMERQINGDDEYSERNSGMGPQQAHNVVVAWQVQRLRRLFGVVWSFP
jgi:hypothetical protein